MYLTLTRSLLLSAFLFVLVFTFALTAQAQEVDTSANTTETRKPLLRPEAFKERAAEVRGSVLERRAMMGSTSARFMERKDALAERSTMIRMRLASSSDEFRAKVAARRAALGAQVTDRLKQGLSQMKERMEALAGRLEQIISRIETRIEKIEAAGGDTGSAESHIADAKASLEAARAAVAALGETTAEEVVDAEVPQERFESIRTEVAAIRAHFKDAHESIRSAVEALKEAARATGPGVSDAVSADPEDRE